MCPSAPPCTLAAIVLPHPHLRPPRHPHLRTDLSPPQDLTFTVQPKTGGPPVEILKGVSGEVLPGRVLAIMGASGAGKTTVRGHRHQQSRECGVRSQQLRASRQQGSCLLLSKLDQLLLPLWAGGQGAAPQDVGPLSACR